MKIIHLNGASSSGKTSLSRMLQEILTENYLYIGIDTIISMMPYKCNDFSSISSKEGFSYKKVQLPNNEKAVRIVTGEYGESVIYTFHKIIKTIVDNGNNLIIDNIANGVKEIKAWKQELLFHSFTSVGVRCSLPELKVREVSRGDRMYGSAAEHYYRIHKNVVYDIEVHTSKNSIIECAQQVADYIASLPK